ncbi:hypothetical protein [Streptomyces sp. NPDC060194]|uniref:hypothetical protein n=1 Tax=Streptomyces sp. NPDC060194 TaxID=3347069 RepID=UPI00364F1B2D
MSEGGQLAATGSGLGAIAIGGGIMLDAGIAIVATAVVLVVGGMLAIRFGFRRGRSAGQE